MGDDGDAVGFRRRSAFGRLRLRDARRDGTQGGAVGRDHRRRGVSRLGGRASVEQKLFTDIALIMTSRAKAELVIITITLIYGSTFALCKTGLTYVSPFLFVATRFGLGALIFGILLRRQLPFISSTTLRKGIVLGIFFGVGLTLQIFGLRYTTASKSGFITGMFVVFTPLTQYLIQRHSPKIGNLIGIGIVLMGLYLLASPQGSRLNVGDSLTLAAAVLFAFHIVYLDVLTHDENPLQLTFLQVACAAVIGLLLTPFEARKFTWTGELIGVLFYMIILATVVNTYAFTKYQKDTTPTRAAVLYSMEPVLSAVIAYLLLGELLGKLGVVGATLIVGGILVSQLSDSVWKFLSANLRESARIKI
jgi:drug/metabolite transporter (DMT)-like permease